MCRIQKKYKFISYRPYPELYLTEQDIDFHISRDSPGLYRRILFYNHSTILPVWNIKQTKGIFRNKIVQTLHSRISLSVGGKVAWSRVAFEELSHLQLDPARAHNEDGLQQQMIKCLQRGKEARISRPQDLCLQIPNQ